MGNFKPAEHLMKVKGNQDYLETRWRLVWLREEHPEAVIETEIVSHDLDAKSVLIRASVTLPTGGKATAHCMCSEGEFKFGYLEKAETQSVGRALAMLGYGTSAAGADLDEGDRPADAPNQPVSQTRTPSTPTAAAPRPIPQPKPAKPNADHDMPEEADLCDELDKELTGAADLTTLAACWTHVQDLARERLLSSVEVDRLLKTKDCRKARLATAQPEPVAAGASA